MREVVVHKEVRAWTNLASQLTPQPNNLDEKAYARKLHSAIRREFPELHVKRFWEVAVGPHVRCLHYYTADTSPRPCSR